METTNSGGRRLRLVIWDGEHSCHTIVRPECVPLCDAGNLQRSSIVAITKYNIERMQKNKHVLVIEELRVEHHSAPRFSDKVVSVDEYFAGNPGDEALPQAGVPAASTPPAAPLVSHQPAVQHQSSTPRSNIFAIEQLSPYQNSWTIKARVSYKGDIRTWTNARGEGKLFNVNLLDESNEIRATAFNDVADKFYDLLQEGKVYYFSKARIQQAKPQFSNLSHPYELSFDRDTEVEECFESDNIPKLLFNFTTLNKIAECETNSVIDVLGVLKEVHDPFQITAKASGRPFDRRDVVIVDDSNFAITVGLWNKTALDFNLPVGSVVAFKGAKISDFGGKSLSLTQSATIVPSPDSPEAYKLKGWFDTQGQSQSFTSLKTEVGHSSPNDRITLGQAQAENLGMNEKPDYFSSKATVSFLRTENFCYPACSSEGCNRKVVEQNSGTWRCEKCDMDHAAPSYRYVLSASLLDSSGQIWVSMFDEHAQQMLGVTAGELMQMKENNDENGEFTKVISNVQMKEYNFRFKAKQDAYNGNVRVRYQVMRLAEIDFTAESKALVGKLDALMV
ncbi:hypothetical protein BABINDRAFT_37888 [Babjeviella inositovora NRRL Y-12698]|uniref:Replication protein A subunit n=1 Tax=Babjeviella inositovora NRRL Y-12698 TaxID=984486 RepID=A0A1E3QQ02_9ASCO|nr:uncharacterized protein BABINDRAFT_37888 [Babjeviella inositovora NRRL Y-12698]ODQ79152.1 hypothetical protein BABINDRAFT_37888 [Babjeviella inositovora NRRL Y-12698]